MNESATKTMSRAKKGPMAPAPRLDEALQPVADAVASWPGVVASVHWHLNDRTRVDGADFYVGDLELGHIHLDGDIHLATSPELGRAIVTERLARPFPYARGWVHEYIYVIGAGAAIELFRRNYDWLRARS